MEYRRGQNGLDDGFDRGSGDAETSTNKGSAIRYFGKRLALVLVAIAVIMSIGTLVFLKKTDEQSYGISYGGGPFESRHFQGTYGPSSSLRFNGYWDKWYTYPASVRNYIVSDLDTESDEGAVDVIQATSSDDQTIDWQLSLSFKLNGNDLQQFHEDVGLRYKAYEDSGWNKMLQQTLRQQLINSLQVITRQYTVEELWSNADVLKEVQTELGTTIKDRVNQSLGGEFFCGPTFVYGEPDCPDFQVQVKKPGIPPDIKAAFEENRTSAILIETRKNEIEQRKAEAEAIAELNKQLTPEYVTLKAIESGAIDFWVLPGNAGVSLQTPDRKDSTPVPTP